MRLGRPAAFAAVAVVAAAVALVPALTSDEGGIVPIPEIDLAGPDSNASAPRPASGMASMRVNGKRAAVRLAIRPGRVVEGERPVMTVENRGEIELAHGTTFRLLVRTPTGWHWVNKHQAFRLPLLFLGPGEETDSEDIGMYVDTPQALPFAPGIYRVSKTFDTDPFTDDAPSLTVSVEFEIVRADGNEDATTTASEPFVPYPGSEWYGPDGEPLPMEEERINVITGPDHCEWEAAVMLHMNWPPGSSEKDAQEDLQYIRDPQDVIGSPMAERFVGDTSLPPGARYTGYRTDFMELWVRTYHRGMPVVATASPPDRIYLVFADRVESWPRAKSMIACG